VKCHLNYVVQDTITWEQSAAYILEHHAAVRSFVKNFGLNLTVPYLHNGKPSDYLPDFVVRLEAEGERYLIVEIKGADWGDTAQIKAQAAHRWCAAVSAAGRTMRLFSTVCARSRWPALTRRRMSSSAVEADALPSSASARSFGACPHHCVEK
jgi:type III restriction enzyme